MSRVIIAMAFLYNSAGVYLINPAGVFMQSGLEPITILSLSDDAVWTWFTDPRTIYYNGQTYFGYVDKSGSVKVRSLTHNGNQLSDEFTLHSALQVDDHANPSFLIRNSDKRVIAFYSAHNGSTIYKRVSTNPEDVTAWGAAASLDASLGGTQYSYTLPIQLTGEANEPIYLFYRDWISSSDRCPWFSKSVDDGATWAAGTKLIANGTLRPYVKVAQNGDDRIDFAVSAAHPNEGVSSLYHFYYQGGSYYKTDGTLIESALPLALSDMTLIYNATSVKSWVWDIAIDDDGHPVIVHAVFPTTSDHRYRYARWNGSSWVDNEITAAGGYLYAAEAYYSGGITIDPADVDVVYLSKVVDEQWEIYKYITTNSGVSWAGRAITNESEAKNIRPTCVLNHVGDLKVIWLQGTYTTYTDYDMAVKGTDT